MSECMKKIPLFYIVKGLFLIFLALCFMKFVAPWLFYSVGALIGLIFSINKYLGFVFLVSVVLVIGILIGYSKVGEQFKLPSFHTKLKKKKNDGADEESG